MTVPGVLTYYRIAPPAMSAEVGEIVELGGLVNQRFTSGLQDPTTGLEWSLVSGAADGKITKTTGKLVCRSTPGVMVARARHKTNKKYADCTINVLPATAGGGTEEPPEEPNPEPEPPVVPKILFLYGAEPNDIGLLWDGSVEVANSELVLKCQVAKARGGHVIGAQGSYTLYQARDPQTGKMVYKRELYRNRVESMAPYAADLLALYQAGALVGIQACDDWAGERWPPDGLSIDELSWMAAKWSEVIPGVPIILRARPRQFVDKVPQGYSIFICQYRYWGGLGTPTQFRDAEQALARTRGHKLLWSMNFLNGGSNVGGVKKPMSPDQIRTAGLAFADGDSDISLGIGGWMKDPLLSQPAYLAALKDVKDAMLA